MDARSQTCANCGNEFVKRGKGYKRFSLESKLPKSDVSAKDALKHIQSITFTPVKSARQGNFLCTTCWSLLSTAHQYQLSCSSFREKTSTAGYLGSKLTETSSPLDFQPTHTSTPQPKQQEHHEGGFRKTLFRPARRRSSKWNTIANAVSERHYARAIRGLYNASTGSRRHFIKVVQSEIRREVKALLVNDGFLCGKPTLANMEKFSWDELFAEFEGTAPLLFSAVVSAATTSATKEHMYRGKKKKVNLKPVIGHSLATVLFARAPVKAAFMPTIVSLQLWRGGLKRESIDQLSRLGVCLGEKGTLAAVDRIREGFDTAAENCKAELGRQLENPNASTVPEDPEMAHDMSIALSELDNIDYEINEPSEEDECDDEFVQDEPQTEYDSDNPSSGEETDEDKRDSESSEEDVKTVEDVDERRVVENMETEESKEAEVLHPGFTLCWDNVGKKVTTRHPSVDKKNTYINFALGYLAVNRVPSTHLNHTADSSVLATDIPPVRFIPTDDDYHELRSRMTIIVSRIITRHLKWFNDFMDDCVIHHLIHDHTMESAQRSAMVNLGVFEENPCTTEGAIGIYTRFQKYIPDVNGQPLPTVVFGDGLSCERGNDALKARCNGLTKRERLEGLEPIAQEFHKEAIILQDYFDEFFRGASASEKGTLYHIKNILNFRNVKSDTSENLSHSWEIMCQTTEAFVTLAAMELLDMSDPSDIPTTAPADIEACSKDERRQYLDGVCRQIVAMVWHETDTEALKVDGFENILGFCCEVDKDEDVIGCDSRKSCIRGEWFHYSCVGIDNNDVPDTWYCSDECRQKSREQYHFCFCAKDLGDEVAMIGCSAESRCLNKEWYHIRCIGIAETEIPEGDWYCSQKCRTLCESGRAKKQKTEDTYVPDYMFRHNVAIVWSGLNLMCRRDAVREADGDAMMSHWRIDLLHFFSNKHVKYVIYSHRLLAAINGWLPEKAIQEIRWNRTVNYSGGIGRNLPADLMNEIFNRLFKDMLKDTKGHYTSKTLARCSQMIGPLGEAIDVVFDSKIVEREVYRHRRRHVNRDGNVQVLLRLLKNTKMFHVVPGRQYKAFPAFEHNINPKFPERFLPKMKDLSIKLDKIRKTVMDK